MEHLQLAGPVIALVLEPQDMQPEDAPVWQVRQSAWQSWQLSAVPQAVLTHVQELGAAADSCARVLQVLHLPVFAATEQVRQVTSHRAQVPTSGVGTALELQKQVSDTKVALVRQLVQLEAVPAKQLLQRGLQAKQFALLGQG